MKRLSPYIKDYVKRADMLLLALCVTCAIFGIVVIASATSTLDGGSTRYLIVQTASLILGIFFYALFTVIDVDSMAERWPALIAFEVFSIFLLLTPLGYADNTGNRAWLRFGFIGVQPAEIDKIIFIIVLAAQINYLKNYKNLNSPLSVLLLLVNCMFSIGLIVGVSKDMGSALVYLFIFIVMLFAAGLKFYWFIAGLAGLAAVTPFFWTHVLNQRYRDRILAPYDATIDPSGQGIRWQANQSKIALASGQLTGTGLYNGRQTQAGALPAWIVPMPPG